MESLGAPSCPSPPRPRYHRTVPSLPLQLPSLRNSALPPQAPSISAGPHAPAGNTGLSSGTPTPQFSSLSRSLGPAPPGDPGFFSFSSQALTPGPRGSRPSLTTRPGQQWLRPPHSGACPLRSCRLPPVSAAGTHGPGRARYSPAALLCHNLQLRPRQDFGSGRQIVGSPEVRAPLQQQVPGQTVRLVLSQLPRASALLTSCSDPKSTQPKFRRRLP